MIRARVIGLGQPAAGDDGAGLAVLDALRRDPPPEVALISAPDPIELADLLDGTPTFIVDAVVCRAPPGTLLDLSPEELAQNQAVSSHGFGLAEGISLARALSGEGCLTELRVLGIAIEAPAGAGYGLSPPVSSALQPALQRVRAWLLEVLGA